VGVLASADAAARYNPALLAALDSVRSADASGSLSAT
jgi:hypothetical protein